MQEGGDMGIYVYVELIHFVIQQKLTESSFLHQMSEHSKEGERKGTCQLENH